MTKIAIIHDWLTGMRGGERVLECLCELFPSADLYTLLYVKGSVSPKIEERNIRCSFLQHLPLARSHYRLYLPLMPTAVEQFDLRGYDLVLSSSHCVAKGVLTRPETCHICYCYTPMRYAWDLYHVYFGEDRLGWLGRRLIPFFVNYLRLWDVSAASRVDHFVAISHHIAQRIRKHYRRDCRVIYPPVDTSFFQPRSGPEDYYLMVTAFAPYKRIDLAVEAFNRLGFPLVIVGSGQDEKRLKANSKENVRFLGWQSNEVIRDLYAGCKAFIFPGEEDFGLTPLEAQAAGRPVIAYGRGGALETIVPWNSNHSATGIFFEEQSVDALMDAVRFFENHQDQFDPVETRNNALRFDRSVFLAQIKSFIEEKLGSHGYAEEI